MAHAARSRVAGVDRRRICPRRGTQAALRRRDRRRPARARACARPRRGQPRARLMPCSRVSSTSPVRGRSTTAPMRAAAAMPTSSCSTRYTARAPGAPRRRAVAIGRAIALDPLNPRTYRAAGSIDYAARRYEEALAPLARAVAAQSRHITNARSHRGNCLMQLGPARRSARRLRGRAQRHVPADRARDRRASPRRPRGGRTGISRTCVADVGDSALYQQAEVLAQWGRADEAMAALEQARRIGDSGLIYLRDRPVARPAPQSSRDSSTLIKAMRLG